MSRYLAAFYHLLISFSVFLVLASIVLLVWFPDFFYTIDGGWEGMRIVIGVDLVLGPMLTMVVFKAGKPGLKFDLAVIGTLQASCLLAGVLVVYSERPLFFIYYDKHFYSASADTYERFELTPPDPADFGGAPAFVIAKAPDNPIEEAGFRKVLYQMGVPIWVYEKSYAPLEDYLPEILDDGVSRQEIETRDERGRLAAWLEKHGGEFEDYAFFPVTSRYLKPYIGIRRSDLEFVGVLDVSQPLALEEGS